MILNSWKLALILGILSILLFLVKLILWPSMSLWYIITPIFVLYIAFVVEICFAVKWMLTHNNIIKTWLHNKWFYIIILAFTIALGKSYYDSQTYQVPQSYCQTDLP